MPIIPYFPNVPVADGVPQVARDPAAKPPPILPAGTSMANEPTVPKYWGVFDDSGANRLLPDNILSVKDSEKTKVSTFPVEKGAFATYNKVVEPYSVHIQITKAGSVQDRSDFLDKLTVLKNGTELVHVVTPERTFLNANLETFDYAQTQSKGQNIIIADCQFIEIRQVTPAYAQTSVIKSGKKASSKSTEDKGKKEPSKVEAFIKKLTVSAKNAWDANRKIKAGT
jgi:hypothetical protein